DQGAGADRMRHAGGHVDRVTGLHADVVERAEQRVAVLPLEPFAVLLPLDLLAQPHPDLCVAAARRDDDPGFGLAVLAAEVCAREGAVGVLVGGEPVGRGAQIDADRRLPTLLAVSTYRV